MKFELIVACSKEGGIAHQNKIPWHLPPDLKRFREITTCKKSAVIMGRKTWDSLHQTPLKDRLNIVISSTLSPIFQPILWIVPSLQEALTALEKHTIESVFLIGGQRIYEEGIRHPDCSGIYLTEVKYDGECDTFFPIHELHRFTPTSISPWMTHNGLEYQYQYYTL